MTKRTSPVSVLTELRAICSSLPSPAEGAHFGGIAFKSGGRMFATYRVVDDDCHVVFGLEPDHADALLATDERFTRYPRAAHTVVVQGSRITDFGELRALVVESYRLATAGAKRSTTKPRPKVRAKARTRT